jgi:beta-galactosidase
MDKFCVQGGQFWINDQPLLLQAGEIHYFRTPVDQWEQRLGLLKAAGFNALATYIPWLWHQVDEGKSDFDGHSHPMRNLAGFLDLAADMGMYIIARPGPYIMAETINEGIPPWVFANHPQCAYISQDGKAQNIASYLHPDFKTCVSHWYTEIFSILTPRQITRGGRIVLVQLDNEMGMIQWVRNSFDTNPNTLERFAAYLRQEYGSLIGTRYPASDLVLFLNNSLSHPKGDNASLVVEDYRNFYRSYLREYASFLLSEARVNGLEVPPVINVHGFMNGGKTFPIGLSQLIEVMEMENVLSATDVYPGTIGESNFHQLLMVNEITKALHNPQQPLFSIEFQAGGNPDFGNGQTSFYDLHTRLCLSSGMRGINHYLFSDGENDPVLSPVKRHEWGHPIRKDGSLRRHYYRYPKLSRVLEAYGVDLTLAQPVVSTTIGFQLDDFKTEVNNESTLSATAMITHQREEVLFDMIGRGLALTHRPFNAIELSRSELDPIATPVVWVMMDKRCDVSTQQKLVHYVRQGGRLILIGRLCDQDSMRQPCTILQEALGIQKVWNNPPFTEGMIQAFGHADIPVSFMETYTGNFGEVIATSQKGAICGFIQPVGEGKVLVFGATIPANTLQDLDLIHQMGMKMNCEPVFTLSDWADVRLSRGEKGSFLFVNNYQDDPVETRVEYQAKMLFDGHALQIPARRGLILPLDWQIRPGVTLIYCTAEVISKVEDSASLTLHTEPAEYWAELSLTGFRCEGAETIKEENNLRLVRIHGTDGFIVLQKE